MIYLIQADFKKGFIFTRLPSIFTYHTLLSVLFGILFYLHSTLLLGKN